MFLSELINGTCELNDGIAELFAEKGLCRWICWVYPVVFFYCYPFMGSTTAEGLN